MWTHITGLSLFLAIQGRTHSSSGRRSPFLVLRSWPQGYRVFSFFKLCLPYTQIFLSCKLTWFYPPRTGLSLSDLPVPSSLLNTNLPRPGQLFWYPVPSSIPLLSLLLLVPSPIPYLPISLSPYILFFSFLLFSSFLSAFIVSSSEPFLELMCDVNFTFLLKH